MWLFLGSECLLFGGLISTYMLYRRPPASIGLGPDQIYDIPFTSVSSFVLLMSSLTMVLGRVVDAARTTSGDARLWLVATALLGATFVGGQVYEFTSSTARASASRPACSARASTRSPASTASTSPSASSCCCRCGACSRADRVSRRQGRGRRARRPLLALRRHRLDRHLHRSST